MMLAAAVNRLRRKIDASEAPCAQWPEMTFWTPAPPTSHPTVSLGCDEVTAALTLIASWAEVATGLLIVLLTIRRSTVGVTEAAVSLPSRVAMMPPETPWILLLSTLMCIWPAQVLPLLMSMASALAVGSPLSLITFPLIVPVRLAVIAVLPPRMV